MEVRNPAYTEDGSITCEIRHPRFGWIPFNARKDDPEERGRAVFAKAEAMGPASYEPPEVEPEPTPTLRPWQFLGMADAAGLTPQIEAAIEKIEDPMQRAVTRRKAFHAAEYRRDDPIIEQLRPALTYQGETLTADRLDALWREAAQL